MNRRLIIIIIIAIVICIIVTGVILFYSGIFHSGSSKGDGKGDGKGDDECVKKCDNKKCGEDDGCEGLCQGACDDPKDECKDAVCTARVCTGRCDNNYCDCPFKDDFCSSMRGNVCISNLGRRYILRSLNGRGANNEPLYVAKLSFMTSDILLAQNFTVSCYKSIDDQCLEAYAPAEGEYLTPQVIVRDKGAKNLILYTSLHTDSLVWSLCYLDYYLDFHSQQIYLDTCIPNGYITVIVNEAADIHKSFVEKVFI